MDKHGYTRVQMTETCNVEVRGAFVEKYSDFRIYDRTLKKGQIIKGIFFNKDEDGISFQLSHGPCIFNFPKSYKVLRGPKYLPKHFKKQLVCA